MRAMFGLVSLLVCVGVILYIFAKTEAPVIERGKQAQDQAQQISGRGQDGRSAINSFKVEPEQQGNRLNAMLVTDVTPGGAMDTFYGLKKGDRILSITTNAGLQKVNDASNGDVEMAKDMMLETFRASLPIVVERDGNQLTLPASAAPPVTGSPASQSVGNAAPAQPAPQAAPPPRNVWDQVNGIKGKLSGQ